MSDIHTVNVTMYGAHGSQPQRRRVQVLADSAGDALAQALRICENNLPTINLDAEHARRYMSHAERATLIAPDVTTNPHRTPSYRTA